MVNVNGFCLNIRFFFCYSRAEVSKAFHSFLVKQLTNDNSDVRELAVNALGNIGDSTAVPHLIKLFNHITKITTTDMKEIPEKNYKEEIIRRSRELYCRKTEDVKKIVRQRLNKWNPDFVQEQYNIEYDNHPSQENIIPSYDTFR
ncbi:HEAT repeat domain-containing protein [Candidatus Latescibacterota bacterium]